MFNYLIHLNFIQVIQVFDNTTMMLTQNNWYYIVNMTDNEKESLDKFSYSSNLLKKKDKNKFLNE